jgi:hypothetical protein
VTQDNYRDKLEECLTKYKTPEERLAFQDGIQFQIEELNRIGYTGLFKGYTNGNAKKEVDKTNIEGTR